MPPSWSTLTMIGRWPAAARRSPTSVATCAGERTFRRAPVSWSRSNRITPPSPPSRSAVRSHGVWSSREPRKPTIRRPAIFSRSASGALGLAAGADAEAAGDGEADDGIGDPGSGDPGLEGVGAVGLPHAARKRASPPSAAARRSSRRVKAGAALGSRRAATGSIGSEPTSAGGTSPRPDSWDDSRLPPAPGGQAAGRTTESNVRKPLLAASLSGLLLSGLVGGAATAHPDNDKTLHFVLTCDDGHIWNA